MFQTEGWGVSDLALPGAGFGRAGGVSFGGDDDAVESMCRICRNSRAGLDLDAESEETVLNVGICMDLLGCRLLQTTHSIPS